MGIRRGLKASLVIDYLPLLHKLNTLFSTKLRRLSGEHSQSLQPLRQPLAVEEQRDPEEPGDPSYPKGLEDHGDRGDPEDLLGREDPWDPRGHLGAWGRQGA